MAWRGRRVQHWSMMLHNIWPIKLYYYKSCYSIYSTHELWLHNGITSVHSHRMCNSHVATRTYNGLGLFSKIDCNPLQFLCKDCLNVHPEQREVLVLLNKWWWELCTQNHHLVACVQRSLQHVQYVNRSDSMYTCGSLKWISKRCSSLISISDWCWP